MLLLAGLVIGLQQKTGSPVLDDLLKRYRDLNAAFEQYKAGGQRVFEVVTKDFFWRKPDGTPLKGPDALAMFNAHVPLTDTKDAAPTVAGEGGRYVSNRGGVTKGDDLRAVITVKFRYESVRRPGTSRHLLVTDGWIKRGSEPWKLRFRACERDIRTP